MTSPPARLSRSSSGARSGRAARFFTPEYDKFAKIFDRQYHSPSKVLKLEDDPWGSCAMYSPEKMKSGGGLMAPPGCFPGRYSPTYRSSDPRRCVPNPSVSTTTLQQEPPLYCNPALGSFASRLRVPYQRINIDFD